MLNIPISGVESWLFATLLLVWAGLLIGGWLTGSDDQGDNLHRLPVGARLGSSFVLVLSAWMWFTITRGTQGSGLAAGIAIGMTCGLIGDVFMADQIKVRHPILYGMAAFGLGHIAYITGLLLSDSAGTLTFPPLALVGAGWVSSVLLWYVVIWRSPKPTITHAAALLYSLLLMSVVIVALHLAFERSLFAVIALGALLFLLSDVLLSLQLFRKWHFKNIGDVVWFLYGSGQMLIVFGIIFENVFSTIFM